MLESAKPVERRGRVLARIQEGSGAFYASVTTETGEVPGGTGTSAPHRRDFLDRLNWQIIPLLFIGLGVTARLTSFAAHRSLWKDEIRLSLNIVRRPLLELLQPLWYDQADEQERDDPAVGG